MSSRRAAAPLQRCSRCDIRRPTAENGRCLVCNSRIHATAEAVLDVVQELDVDLASAPIEVVADRVDADPDTLDLALEELGRDPA